MEWIPKLCAVCFALTAIVCDAQRQQATNDLRFCLPNLKGYLFQNPLTQRCYQFVTKVEDRGTWEDAREYCQENSGRLVNVENQDKQDMLEGFLSEVNNTYKPSADYDPLNELTWGNYDPDVWIGAMRDSDGSTWRFDQYATSRTVRSVIVNWFNYGTDQKLLNEQNAERNRFSTDTCLFMRFNWDGPDVLYPWYQHQTCSDPSGHKHPYICEYEGYEYRQGTLTKSWLIVIMVLAFNLCCGFLACTMYCLWDKIHTSYNVLQV